MGKLAETIIFLFKDPSGFSTAIADCLYPLPTSSYRKHGESFELPLDSFGIKDQKACGDQIHFVDENGNSKVTIVLLEKYEPPVLVCAINEVLTHVIGEGMSSIPTLIVPFVGTSSQLKLENQKLTKEGTMVTLYGFQMGPETDVSRKIARRTQKLLSSSQIHYEPLACLLQLLGVLKLPTIILTGQKAQNLSGTSSGEELEISKAVGEFLADITYLSFSKETVRLVRVKTTNDHKEPWRALYG